MPRVMCTVCPMLKTQPHKFHRKAALLSPACPYEHHPEKNSPDIICPPPSCVSHSSVCPLCPPSSFSIGVKPRPSEIMIMQPFFSLLSLCLYFALPPSLPFVHASVIAVVTLKPGRIAQGSMCRGEPSFNCRLFVMEIRSHSRNNG